MRILSRDYAPASTSIDSRGVPDSLQIQKLTSLTGIMPY